MDAWDLPSLPSLAFLYADGSAFFAGTPHEYDYCLTATPEEWSAIVEAMPWLTSDDP